MDEYTRATREHKLQMMRLKNEAERIKTQNELEELRRVSEEERKKAQSDLEHREWLEDQARKLQQAKVAKQVAMTKGGDNRGVDGDLSAGSAYNSVEGYQIYFDNVLGLPGKVHRVGLVFCFYDRSEQKIQVKSIPSVDTDAGDDNTRQAVFGLRRQFKNVPPSVTLRLVVEIQKIISIPKSPNEQPKVQSLAWCIVPLAHRVTHRACAQYAIAGREVLSVSWSRSRTGYTGSVSDLSSFHKSTRAFVVFSFVLPLAYATSPPPVSAIA